LLEIFAARASASSDLFKLVILTDPSLALESSTDLAEAREKGGKAKGRFPPCITVRRQAPGELLRWQEATNPPRFLSFFREKKKKTIWSTEKKKNVPDAALDRRIKEIGALPYRYQPPGYIWIYLFCME
jgi:hypothetical protein